MLEVGPCYIAFRDSEMCIGAEFRVSSEEYKKVTASGRTGVREVCTTKAGSRATLTKIRRNFNISRRWERAECNPLDKRVPPPWCLLTNRGHRFRAELRRMRMGAMSTNEEEASIAEELERIVSLCYIRSREGTGARRTCSSQERQRRGERERWSCWIVSKKFRRALSPKQIAWVHRTERANGRRFRSLVFAIIAVTERRSDRTGAQPTGSIIPFRRRHFSVVS